MPKIFVSYRRLDSQERAHRIADWLTQKYGKRNVFIDIAQIPGGADFAKVITSSVEEADVILVIIGDKWESEFSKRNSNTDFVYIEVSHALRSSKLVIPTLIDSSIDLESTSLPKPIGEITKLNYMYAREGQDFHSDMQRIQHAIDQRFGSQRRYISIGLGIIIVIIIGFLALASPNISLPFQASQPTSTKTPSATTTITLTVTSTPTYTPSVTSSPTETLTRTYTVTATLTDTDTPPPTQTLTPSDTPSSPPTEDTDLSDQPTLATEIQTCVDRLDTEMVFVPPSMFTMGSDNDFAEINEMPIREVTVDGFCIDVHEVTNEAFIGCVESEACLPPTDKSSRLIDDYYGNTLYLNFPVVNVTRDQAQAFCVYRGGRLPTEAEWELVARYDPSGVHDRIYAWGNESPEITRTNYSGVGLGDVTEIKQYPAGRSSIGLYDLNGNVAEWVLDQYEFYSNDSVTNPINQNTGDSYVIRGGSYLDNSGDIRSSSRDSADGTSSSNRVGFRCVIDIQAR